MPSHVAVPRRGALAFWDTLKNLKPGRTKAASTVSGRVPMPTYGLSSSGVYRAPGASALAFWGENVEGYDALLNGAFDYETAIGVYQDNAVVASCLQFVISSFCACNLQVGRLEGGEYIADQSHPLLDLLAKPHADYDGDWLMAALLSDYWQVGNAYLNVVRSGVSGPPVELQVLGARITEPVKLENDPARLLDHYRYRPDGRVTDIPAEQVVHFRYSIPDATDMRIGASPLYPVRRDVYSDNKASEVQSALLRRPQPSGLLMPESADVEVDRDEMRSIKASLTEASSGQNSGQVLALSAGVKWQPLSFSASELALDKVHETPEVRICSIFGIPPIVLYLGAGLKSSTYNNGETAHKAAWQNCIIPLQDYIAQVLTAKLLPMFPGSAGKVVFWDRASVGVLQEDINAARMAAREDYKLGIITLEEARGEGGRLATPTVGTLQTPAPAPADATNLGKGYRLKRTNGGIYDAADRFRSALMDDETEAVQALANAYNRVQRELQKEIESILTDMAAADDATRYSMVLARANALAEQIESAMADFADRGAAIVEDGQRKTIDTALGHTESMTRASLGTPPPGVSVEFARVPAEALEVLVGMAGNGSPLYAVLEVAGKEYASEIREILVSSVAQGINPREVARRIAGATGANRARMETICRTEMLRAGREASRKSYEENADIISGYIRLSAADLRTCAACWALHGSKVALTDRFAQHANCRCTLAPDVKSWAEITGDASLPDDRIPIPDGESLFSRLSRAEQEEILGAGLYRLYENGARLTDFVNRSFDPQWGPTVTVSTVASAAARAEIYL